MTDVFLDVVDENDEIIGKALRSEIHQKGLLHREVHVWFITPQKEIVFQIRNMNSPHYPLPLLDATAGGHVELGDAYLEAGIREAEEETGIRLTESDLIWMGAVRVSEGFPKKNIVNHVFRGLYVYRFNQNISDLRPERGKVISFIPVSLDDLIAKDHPLHNQFLVNPFLASDEMIAVFRKMLDE